MKKLQEYLFINSHNFQNVTFYGQVKNFFTIFALTEPLMKCQNQELKKSIKNVNYLKTFSNYYYFLII